MTGPCDRPRMLAEEGDAAEIARDWYVPMVRARRRPTVAEALEIVLREHAEALDRLGREETS